MIIMSRREAIQKISEQSEIILNNIYYEKTKAGLEKYTEIIKSFKKEWQKFQELDAIIYNTISNIEFQIKLKTSEFSRLQKFMQEPEKPKYFKQIINNELQQY